MQSMRVRGQRLGSREEDKKEQGDGDLVKSGLVVIPDSFFSTCCGHSRTHMIQIVFLVESGGGQNCLH